MTAQRYPQKPVVIQWWKNGDHPDDGVGEDIPSAVTEETGETFVRAEGKVVRFFRHPDVPGDQLCERCGLQMRDHGWIDTLPDGITVCPGDWVVTAARSKTETDGMDFSEALRALRRGQRVTRTYWNGTGKYVVYQKGYPDGIAINANTAEATGIPEGSVRSFHPYLMTKEEGGFVQWNPSQRDILADDWRIDT